MLSGVSFQHLCTVMQRMLLLALAFQCGSAFVASQVPQLVGHCHKTLPWRVAATRVGKPKMAEVSRQDATEAAIHLLQDAVRAKAAGDLDEADALYTSATEKLLAGARAGESATEKRAAARAGESATEKRACCHGDIAFSMAEARCRCVPHSSTDAFWNRRLVRLLTTPLRARRSVLQTRLLCSTDVTPPSRSQLFRLAVGVGVPMVGFGVADNAIMIVAGDQIDATLGVKFGFSTMAAAGLGNLLSDICGISLGELIEGWCVRFGLEAPALTAEQAAMRATRMVKWGAGALGITIGGLMGMLPLLLLSPLRAKSGVLSA